MLADNKPLARQWEKCAILFLQTNREEEKLGKLLGPIRKAITEPEVAATIGKTLSEFSYMGRFFFEKEAVLIEDAMRKKLSLRYPSISAVKRADNNEIIRMWGNFPHSPKTKREKKVYDLVYEKLKEAVKGDPTTNTSRMA